jgi:hypothetical protein
VLIADWDAADVCAKMELSATPVTRHGIHMPDDMSAFLLTVFSACFLEDDEEGMRVALTYITALIDYSLI